MGALIVEPATSGCPKTGRGGLGHGFSASHGATRPKEVGAPSGVGRRLEEALRYAGRTEEMIQCPTPEKLGAKIIKEGQKRRGRRQSETDQA